MSGSNTIDFTGAKPVVDFAGARPTIDFTGATLTPEPMQSLEKMAEPVDLLAGFTPEKKQSIRDTFTSEEEAKHRMSQYLSSAMGLDEDWVRETYPVTSRNYGFTGDNATAHYAQTVNRLAKQWDRIQKTKEALGPKFRNTPLHKAIPQVRSQLDILAGLDNKDWITGVLNSGDVGMQQALNSIRSGLNKGAGAIDKVVVKAARKTAEAVGFDVDGDAKVSSPFDEFAEFWDNANEEYRINANIPKEIQESYRGQIAEGIGALPVWGIAMATGAPGQVALTAGLYDEAVTKYRNAVPEDEQSPMMELAMGLGYATVAARLEKLGFSKMLKPIFKGGGKLSLKQIANRGQQFAVGTGTETGTELLQTLLLNAEMMGIDPDARLFDELGLREFIVISSVSAFGTGGATSIGLVQDVATGFYPSPLTQDGSAPLHETIKEKANRVGVEALKEMHQEGDPRIDLIDDLVSENTEVAQKAEQQYIDLTIPEPKGEAYERVQEELTSLLRSESVARTVLEVSKETGFSVSDIEAFITESFGTTLNTESTEAFIETFGKQEGQKIESRVFDEIYKSFDGDFHYKSLNDVLDVIAKSNLPIAKIAKGLLGRHDDVKITVLKTREASSDVEENVGGSYNENNKRIKIHTRGNKDPRWLIHSIVHEALHAEFFKQLESSQGGSSWIFGVSSINRDTNQSLEDYKRELKEKFNTKGGIDNRAKPIVEVYLDFLEAFDPREGGLQKPYGMYSVHEFVSEALSSPRFQAELNAIKSKNGKSLWSKFVDAVASMLEEIGIDFDSKSMLAEALKAIEKSSNAEQAKRNRKTKKRGVPAQTTEAFGELFIKHIKLSEKQINKIQQALDVARGIKEEAVDLSQPLFTEEEVGAIEDMLAGNFPEQDFVSQDIYARSATPTDTPAAKARRSAMARASKKIVALTDKITALKNSFKKQDTNIRESVRELVALAEQLPPSIRSKVLPKIKKVTRIKSKESQQRVIDAAELQVRELADVFYRAEAQTKLSNRIKSSLKSQKSSMAFDEFKEIDEISKMSRDEAEAKAAMLLAKEELTEKETTTLSNLNIFGGILNPKEAIGFSAAQAKAALAEAEYLSRTGKSKAAEWRAAQKAEQERINAGAIDAVTDPKAKKLSSDKLNVLEKKFTRRLKNARNMIFGDALNGLENLFDNLVVKGEQFTSFLHTELYRPTWQNSIKKFIGINEDTKMLSDLYESVWGDKAGDKLSEFDETVENSGVYYESQGLGIEEKTLSKKHGVQWWLRIHEAGNRQTILGMLGMRERPMKGKGLTKAELKERNAEVAEWEKEADARIESFRKQIEAFIGDDGVAIAQGVQDIYRQLGIKFIENVQRMDGRTPDVVNNFAGPLSRLHNAKQTEDAMELAGAYDFLVLSAKTGSFKERTKTTSEIKIDPFDVTLLSHIHSMNHAYAHAEWARTMNNLLNNHDFERAVRQRSGSKVVLELIKKNSEIVARGYIRTDTVEKFIGKLTRNIIRAKLGWNITSAVKQMASQLAYIATPGMPVGSYIKYATKSRKSPSEHMKKLRFLFDSFYMQERYASGFDITMKELKTGRNIKMTKRSILERYDDTALLPTEFFDALAILQGGQPVYDWAYDTKFKETGDHALAEEHAMITFVEATKRAQQSSAAEDRGYFQSMKAIGKLMTIFKTAPIQYNRLTDGAIRARIAGRISTVSMMKTIFVYRVLMPQMFQAMTSAVLAALFPDDRDWEKVWKRQGQAFVLGNMQAIPFIGTLAEKATNELFDTKFPDPSFMIFDQLISAGQGLARIWDGISEGDDEKIEKGVADIVEATGDLTGAPTAITKKALETIEANSDLDVPLIDASRKK